MLRLARTSSSPVPLELDGVTPDRLLTLSALEVAKLPVAHGNRTEPLGDHFTVTGDPADGRLHLSGDTATVKRIGEGMTAGRIVVEAGVGMHAGARMTGGELVVEGDAGDWLGAELRGGSILVGGRAGDCSGAAYRGSRWGMTGGVIHVRGDAGGECGLLMRRGLILVGGACGEFAGASMIAGTLVAGRLVRGAGAGMKRGTLIADAVDELAPGFRFSCDYRPAYLALLAAELRRHGYAAGWLDGRPVRCFRGDVLTGGNGELLV
jgi:formylmethanofuran dehydrogenase subunit C